MNRAGAPRSSAAAATTPHATRDEIAGFVIDILAPPARDRFERHVAACARCAAALTTEAAAEATLRSLWPRVERPLAPVLPLSAVQPARARPVALPARHRSAVRGPRRLASGGIANGLAAAVITVLFMGYWSDGDRAGRPGGAQRFVRAARPSWSEMAGAGADGAFCRLGLMSSGDGAAPPGVAPGERMCTMTAPMIEPMIEPMIDPIGGVASSADRPGLCEAPSAPSCDLP